MFFDRNEIHIQAFQEIPPAKLIPGDSSSSTFHDFQESIILKYQKFRNSEFQKFKKWTLKVSGIAKFLSFRSPQQKIPISQGGSLIFLDFFKVFWCNKMKKYGRPEPKTLIIHEMLTSRPIPVDKSTKKNGFLLMPFF